MAEPLNKEEAFESRLENKIKKNYRGSLYAPDEDYSRAGAAIAESLRAVNRSVEEGLYLTEWYFQNAEPWLSISDIGGVVSSTLSALGKSGLTAKMAVDILQAYSASPINQGSVLKLADAANSTVGTIKETYHNVKYVKKLLESYLANTDICSEPKELHKAIDRTLLTLMGSHFKKEDVALLIESYGAYTGRKETPDKLCDSVCQTIVYAKKNMIPLKQVIKRFQPIERKEGRAYSSDNIYEIITSL